VRYFDTENKKK